MKLKKGMAEKTFRDLYEERKREKQPTAAQQFVTEVAALTQKTENTIRNWIGGRQKPDYADRLLISRKYGVDINSLFPEKPEEK